MRVFVVRHGESEGNFAGTLEGARSDTHLSARGVEQARLLARRLSGEALDAAFTSPMIRARGTTESLLAGRDGGPGAADADLLAVDGGRGARQPPAAPRQ